MSMLSMRTHAAEVMEIYTIPQNKDPLLDQASPLSEFSPLTCDAPDLHSGLMISTLPESLLILTHNTPDLDGGHSPLPESPLTRFEPSVQPTTSPGIDGGPRTSPSLSPPPRIRNIPASTLTSTAMVNPRKHRYTSTREVQAKTATRSNCKAPEWSKKICTTTL